jgi:hypothetical protein
MTTIKLTYEQIQNQKNKNKYSTGKVYAVRSPNTDQFYIGSTIQPLSKRMVDLRTCYFYFKDNFKYSKLSDINQIFEFGDAYIELLEVFPCNSKEELDRRQGELIRINKINCINKIVPGRSKKEYREDNKQKISDTQKEYRNKKKAEGYLRITNEEDSYDIESYEVGGKYWVYPKNVKKINENIEIYG